MADRAQLQRLVEDLVAVQAQCASLAVGLADEKLEQRVALGQRETALRNILYQMVVHPREHTVHLSKVLQATASAHARPTEAQLIVEQASQSLGTLLGLLARLTDEDLDREFEGHSLRKVLEHLATAHGSYLKGIKQGAGVV